MVSLAEDLRAVRDRFVERPGITVMQAFRNAIKDADQSDAHQRREATQFAFGL